MNNEYVRKNIFEIMFKIQPSESCVPKLANIANITK